MKGSAYAGDSITVSDIIQYHYCPRKIYFLRVMEIPASIRRKMEYGSEIHEKEMRRMTERKLIYGFSRDEVEEVMKNMQIEAQKVGLRGKLDVALRLRSGEILPVDTKYTDEVLLHRRYLKQLYAYALLLDHEFGTEVRRGVIYFSKQREPRTVEITDEDKQGVLRDIAQIRRIIASEEIPRPNPERCGYCEVKKYCAP
jgi:CRISPR-associated exonuclease Cas4